MAKQRVMILSPDPKQIESRVRGRSLSGIHFTVHADWDKGVSALSKENFSVIVARKFKKTQTAEAFVQEVLSLASKTPLVLVLPKKGGPSVLVGARWGGGPGLSFLATAGCPADSIGGVFLRRCGAGIAKLRGAPPAVFLAE